MHNKITMEMSICQAENGFSLYELVKKVADSYEKKAFADILKMNLQLTQYPQYSCWLILQPQMQMAIALHIKPIFITSNIFIFS